MRSLFLLFGVFPLVHLSFLFKDFGWDPSELLFAFFFLVILKLGVSFSFVKVFLLNL